MTSFSKLRTSVSRARSFISRGHKSIAYAHMKQSMVTVLGLLILAGCGGGGGGGSASANDGSSAPSSTPASSPAGFWNGTTNTDRVISLIILDDNTFYTFYTPEGDPNNLAGVAQGHAAVNGGTFNANDVQDFNFEENKVMAETVTASFTPRTSFDGSVTAAAGTITFKTTFDPDYDKPAKTTDAAGKYLVQSASISGQRDSVTLTVENNGSILYQGASGCLSTGSITPRASGNIFDLVINFGTAPCSFPRLTLRGIAYYDPTDQSLTGVAPNQARTDIALFTGAKLQ